MRIESADILNRSTSGERASTFQHLRVTQLKERLEANLD